MLVAGSIHPKQFQYTEAVLNMNERDKLRFRREREKLDKLVDQALENGTPISEAYELMKQSKRVQQLMSELDIENEESD
jgi:hypothetical protein